MIIVESAFLEYLKYSFLGITSYFDPGFDVQASGEQVLNVAFAVSIGLFAVSVILPVSTLALNKLTYGLRQKLFPPNTCNIYL